MEPDSLLVRGLVDNASGASPPRSIARRRSSAQPGGGSPYGRGHAPVAAEAEALLGALEDAEATRLRERHDGLDLPLPDACSGRARRSSSRRAATTRSSCSAPRCSGASASTCAATTCAIPRASAAPAKAPRSRSSRRRPTRRSPSPTSPPPPTPRTPAGRCSAATTRSARRSCSARSTSAPTSPGRAPRSTWRATPTCSRA